MNKKSDLDNLIQKLSLLLPKLKQDYPISSMGIFGSYATKTNTKKSDIDILVEFNQPIGFKFFQLKEDLETSLSNKVDLTTKKALKNQLKDQILNEVIKIE